MSKLLGWIWSFSGHVRFYYGTAFIMISGNRSGNDADVTRRELPVGDSLGFTRFFS